MYIKSSSHTHLVFPSLCLILYLLQLSCSGRGREVRGVLISQGFCLFQGRFFFCTISLFWRQNPLHHTHTHFSHPPSNPHPHILSPSSQPTTLSSLRHYLTQFCHACGSICCVLVWSASVDVSFWFSSLHCLVLSALTCLKESLCEREENTRGVEENGSSRRKGSACWHASCCQPHILGEWVPGVCVAETKSIIADASVWEKHLREKWEMLVVCVCVKCVWVWVYVRMWSHFSGISQIQSLDWRPALPTQLMLHSPSCNNAFMLHHGNYSGYKHA